MISTINMANECWNNVADICDRNEEIISSLQRRISAWSKLKYAQPLSKSIKADIVERLFILQKTENVLHIPFSGRIWCEYDKMYESEKKIIDASGAFEWSGKLYVVGKQYGQNSYKSYRVDRMNDAFYKGIDHVDFYKFVYSEYFKDIEPEFSGSLFLHPDHISKIAPGFMALTTNGNYRRLNIIDKCKIIMNFSFLACKLSSWSDYARFSRSLAAWVASEFFDHNQAMEKISTMNLKSAKFPYAALEDSLSRIREL